MMVDVLNEPLRDALRQEAAEAPPPTSTVVGRAFARARTRRRHRLLATAAAVVVVGAAVGATVELGPWRSHHAITVSANPPPTATAMTALVRMQPALTTLFAGGGPVTAQAVPVGQQSGLVLTAGHIRVSVTATPHADSEALTSYIGAVTPSRWADGTIYASTSSGQRESAAFLRPDGLLVELLVTRDAASVPLPSAAAVRAAAQAASTAVPPGSAG